MPLGDYLAGLAFFAVTWGGTAYVAVTVERRRLPRLDPAARSLAIGLLFLAVLLAVHLLPGAVGLLTRGAVAGTALVAALLATRLPRAPCALERAPTPGSRTPDDRVSRSLGAVGALLTSAFAIAALAKLRLDAPTHVDAVSFTLPGVAAWLRSGSIWHTGAFLPLIQIRTYPNNADIVFLASILPWHSDAFVRLTALPLLGMTAVSVYAIGRELRARAGTAALIGALSVASSVVAEPALAELKPDVFMYATFAAGVLFLLRHVRTRAGIDLVLAGLGLGLAFGSRWYGLSSVVVVAVVWAIGLLLARRPVRRVSRDAGVLGGVILAAGGFWLVRNWVLTGNPLYPVKAHLLGLTILDAPPDVITEKFGFTVAHRLGQSGFVTTYLLPDLRTALGLAGAVVVVGAISAAVLGVRHRRAALGARPLALVAAAAGVAASWAIIPGSAQGTPALPEPPDIVVGTSRWLLPALLLGAGATAWAASRARPGALALALDAALLACLLVALPGAYSVTAGHLVAALAVLVLAAGAARYLTRRARRRTSTAGLGVPVLVSGALAVAVAVGLVGYEHQRSYQAGRFAGRSAAVDWIDAHARTGHRVGVAGSWSANAFVPIYGLFGPRLGNDVAYVGPVVDGQLREYDDRARFIGALRRGRYDLLAVGRLQRPDLEHAVPERTLDEPPEARWAQAAGYAEVTRDGAFILLARRPSSPH